MQSAFHCVGGEQGITTVMKVKLPLFLTAKSSFAIATMGLHHNCSLARPLAGSRLCLEQDIPAAPTEDQHPDDPAVNSAAQQVLCQIYQAARQRHLS
jgi:hypothetical protein